MSVFGHYFDDPNLVNPAFLGLTRQNEYQNQYF
jgi:hypothetical protein